MATKYSLQVPAWIDVDSSYIRVANPDLSKYTRTYMTAPLTAGGTTLTVADNDNFNDNDWFILGYPGREETEICDVNQTDPVARGTSLTITNSTKFSHEINTPVTRVYENQMKIYGAATDGGTGTLIATVSVLDWSKDFTAYARTTTDTGTYNYYYAVYYDGTTIGSASDYVAAAGAATSAVGSLADKALVYTNSELGDKITESFLVGAMNDCLQEIEDFMYQDQYANLVAVDWEHDIEEDVSSISTVEGENEYSISSLDPDANHTKADGAIISVRIGAGAPLKKVAPQDMQSTLADAPHTTLSTDATAGGTTVTLTDSYDFAESGSVYICGQTEPITYTANAQATGVLSGVPASGTGAISSTTALATTSVWQNLTPDLPEQYSVYDGKIILDCPVDEDNAGRKLKVRYYKKQPEITGFSDTVDIPFKNIISEYLCYAIYRLKEDMEKADKCYARFQAMLRNAATKQKSVTLDTYTYYNYADPYNTITSDDGET